MSSPLNDRNAKVAFTDPAASMRLTNRLSSMFRLLPLSKRIVVVCVGTDRSTGDSLGPLSGSLLSKYRSPLFDLYGTLEQPVHAMNLDDTLEQLFRTTDDPFVIGIDACLGSVGSIGTVHIVNGPLRPGAGVNKTLTPFGDIHISGVVNVGGLFGYHVLQNTRLHLVMSMSSLIARSLFVAIAINRFADSSHS
ncbi:spore protease YyaC [Cohnella luojiensis]|uniref:Spore protease YyaC n=1 Tax=Cohnella luojiensis TaxID=652876 RepID=A0A4Y8LQH7_9BACL|nr:spore protease YyaC [Cohnella luojiensis]TFE23564.1 spore protease YyaC [Cohnella luojiensis]